MTFNRLAAAAVTAIAAALTLAAAFVCFEAPYTANFGFSLGAIVLSELLFGAFFIGLTFKSASSAPVSAGGWIANFLYLLFTLCAAFLTWMEVKYFVLLQAAGLSAFAVLKIMLLTAERHAAAQSKDDPPPAKIERAKPEWR